MIRDGKTALGIAQIVEAKSNAAGTIKSLVVPAKLNRSFTFAANYGVFTPNTATAGVITKLQHSDTTADADFADVAAIDQVGTFAGVKVDASDDQKSELVGYIGKKPYVRLVCIVPTNATSLLFSADLIVSNGDQPVTVIAPVSAT